MAHMTIGQAARSANVNVETIRYYERIGLIEKPTKPSGAGFREYPASTVEFLKFVRSAKDVGFSLREIKDLQSIQADPDADCSNIRDRVRDKLTEMKSRMASLQAMTATLEELVSTCPGKGAVERCSILNSFANNQQLARG